MKVTILGCGNSLGVPIPTCLCKVCRSKNLKNKRTRPSVWLQPKGKSILIDTSIDFRAQAIREGIRKLDAVLYTHPHQDHIGGMDELRGFHYTQKNKIPIAVNTWSERELKSRFAYLMPIVDITHVSENAFSIGGIKVQPLSVVHGTETNTGYRIDNVAYLTDCQTIPASTFEHMTHLKLLILDCIQLKPHHSHFHLEKSLETIERLKPKKAVLTHMNHDVDYSAVSKRLPKGVVLAYDGLKINV